MQKFNKQGFTLAEVLITLGIIGIVAALTMPMLLEKHQKKEVSTRLRKTVSIIENAMMQSQTVNGEPKEWVYPVDDSIEKLEPFLDEYIYPYLNIAKKCNHTDNSPCFKDIYKIDGINIINEINENWTSFILNDGTAIAVNLQWLL